MATASEEPEWEHRLLIGGYGAFFIGAIKCFTLNDDTGRFLTLAASLAGIGGLMVTIVYLTRFRRIGRISLVPAICLAAIGTVIVIFVRHNLQQQAGQKEAFEQQLPESTSASQRILDRIRARTKTSPGSRAPGLK